MEGVLHFFEDNLLYTLLLVRIDAEVEFVVYLKNHLRTNALCLEAVKDVYHSDFDDVCSCALNGGIDGVALSKTAYGAVGRTDVRQLAAAAEEGSDVPLLASLLLGLFHVVVYLWEGLKEAVDELTGLVA